MVSLCGNTSRSGSSLEPAGLWRERQSHSRTLLSSLRLRDKAESFCLGPYAEEVGSAAKSTHDIAACFLQDLFSQDRFSSFMLPKMFQCLTQILFSAVFQPTFTCLCWRETILGHSRNDPWNLHYVWQDSRFVSVGTTGYWCHHCAAHCAVTFLSMPLIPPMLNSPK